MQKRLSFSTIEVNYSKNQPISKKTRKIYVKNRKIEKLFDMKKKYEPSAFV